MPLFPHALPVALIGGSTLFLSACDLRPQPPKAAPVAAAADPGLHVKAIGPYILVQGGQGEEMYVTTDGAHIKSIPALKAKYGPAFLWFRFEKKAYVIRDAATLTKARELFREDAALEAQEQALEEREAKLEAQREALDARRDAQDPARERLEEEEEALAEEAPAAARARIEGERQKLDKELAALDQELEGLEQAGEALEREREALSLQQERFTETAEQQLQALLAAAVKHGVAVPADDKMK